MESEVFGHKSKESTQMSICNYPMMAIPLGLTMFFPNFVSLPLQDTWGRSLYCPHVHSQTTFPNTKLYISPSIKISIQVSEFSMLAACLLLQIQPAGVWSTSKRCQHKKENGWLIRLLTDLCTLIWNFRIELRKDQHILAMLLFSHYSVERSWRGRLDTCVVAVIFVCGLRQWEDKIRSYNLKAA